MISRRVKIAIAAFVLLFFALALLTRHFTGRSALARYKAELRAKGELLTLADLPSPTCTNGNPNLAKLTNAAAALGDDELVVVMKYSKPGLARPVWREEHLIDSKGFTNDWQDLAQALANNAALLETIRESLKNPEPDIGWLRTNIFDYPRTFVPRRKAARWLAGATVHSLHENQFPSALENLHALFQLAQVQKDDLTLVNQMIRVAIVSLAFATIWEALQKPDWNDAQLAQLQGDLNSIDLVDALETGFLGEKILGMEYFQTARTNKNLRALTGPSARKSTFQEQIIGNVWSVALAEADELSFLEAHQRHLEHIRLVRQGKTWPEVAALLDGDYLWMEELAGSYKRYLHPVTLMAFPNFRKASERAVQAETQRQMILAVVALQRYQLRYGKLPSDLASLLPEFLSNLPHDWMDQTSLKYRRTENGFSLYSVGKDGRDDGGDPTPADPSDKKEYELWSGRDAVWPEAMRDADSLR